MTVNLSPGWHVQGGLVAGLPAPLGGRRARELANLPPFSAGAAPPTPATRAWHSEHCLARDDLIQATGTVDKILGGGRYHITLESGQEVTAQLSGRMRRFRIRVIPGDRVQVGLSPYDPTHGFITFRLREGQNAPGA